MGFYDNVNCRYIITDKYRKVIDIIAKYQEGGELAENLQRTCRGNAGIDFLKVHVPTPENIN
ncbi:MAG: hypothetical protein KHX32_08510 [Clostridiales bacterium]|nr:hypothetical protein [Clostridiales bacterium]